MRRHREAVEREVARHPGVTLAWEERGSHDVARLTIRGRSQFITVSRSASCCRAAANQRADVRRAVRTLKGGQ
jgi:hypothetical protein